MASSNSGASTQLPHLPFEVLSAICAFAEQGDLKRLRFVNPAWNNAAKEYLFKDFYFTLHPDDMLRLQHVAASSHLAKHVKKVVFLADLVKDAVCVQLPEASPRDEDIFATDSEYHGYVGELCVTWVGPGAEKRLGKILDQFPKLQEVEVVRWDDSKVEVEPRPIVLSRNPGSPGTLHRMLYFDFGHGVDPPTIPLLTFLNALGEMDMKKKTVKKLKISRVEWSFWMNVGSHRNPTFLLRSPSAFRNLTTLQIQDLQCPGRIDHSTPPICYCSLWELLSSAENLEHLELLFSPPSSHGLWRCNNPVRTTWFFEELRNLRSLKISACAIPEKRFTAFLRNHATTLESLEMYGIWLIADTEDLDRADMNALVTTDEHEKARYMYSSWHTVLEKLPLMMKLKFVVFRWLQDSQVRRLMNLETGATAKEKGLSEKRQSLQYAEEVGRCFMSKAHGKRYKIPVYGETRVKEGDFWWDWPRPVPN